MLITEGALLRIIKDTWTSTLGFQVDCEPDARLLAAGALTVCAKILDEWSGEVQLDCPLPLARLIAAAIFQVKAESAGQEEILDALSEVVHIVGGNLKALLPQPAQILLPVVREESREAEVRPKPPLISRLTVTTVGHPFVVSLWGGPSAAG